MAIQLDLFPEVKKSLPENEGCCRLMIGGIYTEKNPDDRDPLGPYALCMGSNQFYFIFDGIDHIENIVEVACGHKMMLVEGYALALIKDHKGGGYHIQIRDSGKKGQPDYIIWEGHAEESFDHSLKRFKSVFHK